MHILQDPDKRLYIKSTVVTDFNEAKKIAEELINITKKVDRPYKIWLGMAANQIGYNKRVIPIRNSKNRQKAAISKWSVHPWGGLVATPADYSS